MTIQQMNKRVLPPVNTLLAFEAAARLMSFKLASEELCVTPSAISHQIKVLEDWLGYSLFERRSKGVELTNLGFRYSAKVTAILDQLEDVFLENRDTNKPKVVFTIQTTDSLASHWLIPKIQELSNRLNAPINIVTYGYREKFRDNEADVGLVYSNDLRKLDSTVVTIREDIFAVCSPQYQEKNNIVSLSALSDAVLIHDANLGITWSEWFDRNSTGNQQLASLPRSNDGAYYNHSHLALRAAELGDGVALGSSVLVADGVASGKLIILFPQRVYPMNGGYYYQEKSGSSNSYLIKLFEKWLAGTLAEMIDPAA